TDGSTVFTLQSDGNWVPVKLGDINNLVGWEPGPVSAYLSSVYILQSDFRNIYQFDTAAENPVEPRDWVLPSVRPDLVRAVDMAIDRNIYVLLDNAVSPDTVLLYSQGDLKQEPVPVPYSTEDSE